MTDTYRNAVYISTDSHVTEPIELYAERLDNEWRDRAPQIVNRDGWRTLLIDGMDPRKLMTESELDIAIVGGADPATRHVEQSQDGVSAEVIFPTFALQACFAPDEAGFDAQ